MIVVSTTKLVDGERLFLIISIASRTRLLIITFDKMCINLSGMYGALYTCCGHSLSTNRQKLVLILHVVMRDLYTIFSIRNIFSSQVVVYSFGPTLFVMK